LWLNLALLQGIYSQEDIAITSFNFLEKEVPYAQEKNHRSLAAFVLPFQLLWRIRIGNGFSPDRQPSPSEYQGVRQATFQWFSAEIPQYYAGESFTFLSFAASLNETTWDSSLSSPEDFPHEILLDCEVLWDADSLEEIPTVEGFLLNMQADYPFDEFTQQYLWNANPQNPRSIFQFSDGVGYRSNDFGTAGPAPGPETAPPVGIPAPVAAPPVGIPAPVTDTSTPSPSLQAGPPTDLPQKKTPPEAKCGSLAQLNGRGGAAARAKECDSGRNGRRVKLKGA
jgi:hypothetical protein